MNMFDLSYYFFKLVPIYLLRAYFCTSMVRVGCTGGQKWGQTLILAFDYELNLVITGVWGVINMKTIEPMKYRRQTTTNEN